MSPIFILAGEPTAEKPQPMQVHFSGSGDDWVGILTDVYGSFTPKAAEDTREWRHLAHVSAIQKCLINDRFPPITGMAPTDVQAVMDEVSPEEFGEGEVSVDGAQVVVDTLSYRGLDFALGRIIEQFPFALMRASGERGAWPSVLSIDA